MNTLQDLDEQPTTIVAAPKLMLDRGMIGSATLPEPKKGSSTGFSSLDRRLRQFLLQVQAFKRRADSQLAAAIVPAVARHGA